MTRMNHRNPSLDLLKIVLALFVLGIHCNFLRDHHQLISFLTVDGLFRLAVPVFFIINGYYFKKNVEKGEIKPWIKRILVLYLIWMIIYSPMLMRIPNAKYILLYVFVGFYHLWYINSLLLSGVIIFNLKRMNTSMMLVAALLLFLIGVIIQYLGNYHFFVNGQLDQLTNNLPIYRNFVFTGLPFFSIGYLIHKYHWNKKISKKLNVPLIVVALLLLGVESYINFRSTKEGIDNLFSLIVASPLLFIYFLNSNKEYRINAKNAALYSIAIYLTHPWIIHLLGNENFDSIYLTVLAIIFSLLISYLLIKINLRLKFLL